MGCILSNELLTLRARKPSYNPSDQSATIRWNRRFNVRLSLPHLSLLSPPPPSPSPLGPVVSRGHIGAKDAAQPVAGRASFAYDPH